jgi:biopolymer transport protein ExbD
MIPPLFARLEAISEVTGTRDREHEVTIHCDKRMDFRLIKRVMYTCARAEYADFSLLVLENES